MDAKIDYLSFTADYPDSLQHLPSDERLIASALAESVFSGRILAVMVNEQWEIYKGGKFYVYRAMQPNSKLSLSFDPHKPYFTIELSGQSCEIARNSGFLDEILQLSEKRVTRIDLAVDIETDCIPSDFLSNGYNPIFKARSSISDVTGITEYVGSWNSERFARIYRYHDPHPRSKLLRVEHVLKGDWAKSYVPELLRHGLPHCVAAISRTFQWNSPLWKLGDVTVGRITAPRATPSQATRYRWFVTQVAPSIRKAIEEGWFDFPTFLNEHIYNEQ